MPHDQPYLQAEKKIQQALRSGATSFELCSMNLTELPESIGQLTQLLFLDLRANRLTKIPELPGNLFQLRTLYLSHNELITLPESLGRLTQLTELDLSSNQLTTLPESLGQLTKLTKLNLSDNQLTILPESLGQLTKLTELNLSDNQLAILPESLGRLTQLTNLNLSFNKLTTLPESLGQLTQLQMLDLYDNKFTSLPESLRYLTQLQSLDMSSNQLTLLPDWFGQLSNLKKLFLVWNDIKSLSPQIKNLHKLEELVLGSGDYYYRHTYYSYKEPKYSSNHTGFRLRPSHANQLRELPNEIGNLSALRILSLGGNKLTDIPFSLAQLDDLEILLLNDNPLNPDLAEAHIKGLKAVKAYLRTKVAKHQEKRTLKVFLCHASQDKRIVHELYQKFVAEGWIDPWLDAKKLLPGQDWQTEIRNAVETADNVIIFLSNTSINKDGFVQKELRLAKDIALEKSEGSVFLIPLRLDNCEVPRSLQIYQWADYFGDEQEQTYSKLLESLKLRLEDIKHKKVYTK